MGDRGVVGGSGWMIGVTMLLHWVFDDVRMVGAPPGTAVQRLDERTGTDHVVLNQT